MLFVYRFIFLFLTFQAVYSAHSAALDGPLFFKDCTPKTIYQAFDLPFTEVLRRKPTIHAEDMTPVIFRLDDIKRKGYTHVQISPPQMCTPSFSRLTPHKYCYKDVWYLPYQPYICIFDDAYKQELSELFGTGNDLRSQYGITLSDGTVIGYRLGNSRYGTAKQLKELIVAAKSKGLEIIVDTVVNHVSPDHGGPNTYFDTMRISDLHPISYEGGKFKLSNLNFPKDFFHRRGKGSFGLDTWDWGPDLHTGNATTQEMIVKYLKILSDLGITALRFDAMKHIAPREFREMFEKARALIGADKFFGFAYGEVMDSRKTILSPYYSLAALEDLDMCFSLRNCFSQKGSIKALIAPYGIGESPAVAFSVLHDHFPGVSSGDKHSLMFYSGCDQANMGSTIDSHMAMAYLLARRDPSVITLRFEDELDVCGILERGLHFRNAMKEKKAPHEYMVALNDDVLIVARQFGFAVINKGDRTFRINRKMLDLYPFLSFYIPDGEYKEKNGTTHKSSSLDLYVHPRNVSFLLLQDGSNQESVDVVFECKKEVKLGQKVVIYGNHPLLGNYHYRVDGFNSLSNLQSYDRPTMYPTWRSHKMSFPKGLPLKYYFGITKEWGDSVKKDDDLLKMTVGIEKLDYDTKKTSAALTPDFGGSSEAQPSSEALALSEALVPSKACEKTTVSLTLKNFLAASAFQKIYVSGDTDELGKWDPDKAVPMNATKGQGDWVKDILLPRNGTVLQYKYLMKEREEVVWNLGGNHYAIAKDSTVQITDFWRSKKDFKSLPSWH